MLKSRHSAFINQCSTKNASRSEK